MFNKHNSKTSWTSDICHRLVSDSGPHDIKIKLRLKSPVCPSRFTFHQYLITCVTGSAFCCCCVVSVFSSIVVELIKMFSRGVLSSLSHHLSEVLLITFVSGDKSPNFCGCKAKLKVTSCDSVRCFQ